LGVKTEVSILIMIYFICGVERFVDETKNVYCFSFFFFGWNYCFLFDKEYNYC